MVEFGGVFAPLVTPFTDDGMSLSEIRLARLVARLKGAGVSGFVVCSETGEFPTLSPSERKQAAEIVIRECHADVIVHVTSLSTAVSIDLAQHAARHGARAVIAMPPYYGDLTDEEVESYLLAIASYGDLEVILVDPIARLSAESIQKLEEAPRITIAKPAPMAYRLFERPRSCEFSIGEASCSPMVLIADIAGAKLHDWRELMRDIGSMRIVKTALNWNDIEVGPFRGPYGSLADEPRERLRALMP